MLYLTLGVLVGRPLTNCAEADLCARAPRQLQVCDDRGAPICGARVDAIRPAGNHWGVLLALVRGESDRLTPLGVTDSKGLLVAEVENVEYIRVIRGPEFGSVVRLEPGTSRIELRERKLIRVRLECGRGDLRGVRAVVAAQVGVSPGDLIPVWFSGPSGGNSVELGVASAVNEVAVIQWPSGIGTLLTALVPAWAESPDRVLRMPQSVWASGRVSDDNGASIDSAVVVAIQSIAAGGVACDFGACLTDGGGQYLMPIPLSGHVRYGIAAQGFRLEPVGGWLPREGWDELSDPVEADGNGGRHDWVLVGQ